MIKNSKPADALLSPTEFDELRQTKQFIESVAKGLSDSQKGEVYSTSQVKAHLKKNRTTKL